LGGHGFRRAVTLRLNHFAAAEAGRANPNALGSALHPGVNRTQIYIPAPFGHVMGVTDVISKLRPLAAKIAYLCHGSTPES